MGDQFPDGTGTFNGFEGVSYDGDHIAFVGLGSKVIFSDIGGTMRRWATPSTPAKWPTSPSVPMP